MSEDLSKNVKLFEVKNENPIREFKIGEDGNVEVKETQVTTMKMSSREFITFYRQNLKALEGINDQLSEAARIELEKSRDFLIKQIDELKNIKDEAEKKTMEAYHVMRRDGKIKLMREELAKESSERDVVSLVTLYNRMTDLDKDIVMHELSESEKKEFETILEQNKSVAPEDVKDNG